MSLAKRRWRLRQMAWSLQHSGVARLVLKSSSLTFQQILPGGWGVCHTTPSIHTARFTLLPHPLLPPSCSRASGHSVSHFYYFILTYVEIRVFAYLHICIFAVGHLDLYRPGEISSSRGADKKRGQVHSEEMRPCCHCSIKTLFCKHWCKS